MLQRPLATDAGYWDGNRAVAAKGIAIVSLRPVVLHRVCRALDRLRHRAIDLLSARPGSRGALIIIVEGDLDLESFFQWVYDLPIAEHIRANELAFPWLESIHVLAITLVLGSIAVADLRLLGLASVKRPVSQASSRGPAGHLGGFRGRR